MQDSDDFVRWLLHTHSCTEQQALKPGTILPLHNSGKVGSFMDARGPVEKYPEKKIQSDLASSRYVPCLQKMADCAPIAVYWSVHQLLGF